jgi:hypothetical protein
MSIPPVCLATANPGMGGLMNPPIFDSEATLTVAPVTLNGADFCC